MYAKFVLGAAILGLVGVTGTAHAAENASRAAAAAKIILPLPKCDECWAVVNANATLARGRGVVSVTKGDVATGSYVVKFSRNVASCSYVATVGQPGAGVASPQHLTVATRGGDPSAVYVAAFGPTGTGRPDTPFHLQIEC